MPSFAIDLCHRHSGLGADAPRRQLVRYIGGRRRRTLPSGWRDEAGSGRRKSTVMPRVARARLTFPSKPSPLLCSTSPRAHRLRYDARSEPPEATVTSPRALRPRPSKAQTNTDEPSERGTACPRGHDVSPRRAEGAPLAREPSHGLKASKGEASRSCSVAPNPPTRSPHTKADSHPRASTHVHLLPRAAAPVRGLWQRLPSESECAAAPTLSGRGIKTTTCESMFA